MLRLIKLKEEHDKIVERSKDLSITVEKQKSLINEANAKNFLMNEICLKYLHEFKEFCEENKNNLYKGWGFAHKNNPFYDVENIDNITFSERNKALKVVFCNLTSDYIYKYDVVLIPYDFINNPEDFKEKRLTYVNNTIKKNLLNEYENNIKEIENLKERNIKIKEKLECFE